MRLQPHPPPPRPCPHLHTIKKKMAAIYLYVEQDLITEDPGNSFGIKVAIHEYAHLLQQGFLSRQITSTSPVSVTNRFIVKNYGNVNPIFESKIQAAMDALPDYYTLVPVPTLILLVPIATGGIGTNVLDASVAEVMELQFGVSEGCPGVNFLVRTTANENNAMAEGEAEYYSLNVLTPPLVSEWAVPFQSKQTWTDKRNEGYAMLAGSPGKASFHVTDGSGDTMSALEASTGWRGNPAGELVYAYLIEQWRPQTTHTDLFEIWMEAACVGYSAAFEAKTGSKWSEFVCSMEDYYGVDGNGVTCVPDSAWDLPWASGIYADRDVRSRSRRSTNPDCSAATTISSSSSSAPQCLSQTSDNIVAMQNPYTFNSVPYDASRTVGVNVGTYTFTGITSAHPFGIYISDASLFEVISGILYSSSGRNNFYTGTVVVAVKADFGTASYGCALHGYMGGQVRLRFSSTCTTTPTPTPTPALPPSGQQWTCSKLGWPANVNNVCGESDDRLGNSGASSACNEASFADAGSICAAAGARLCTTDEIDSGVTAGTGCGFDTQYAWTSTWCGLGPEGGKYYVSMGAGGAAAADRKCKNPKKSYPVRCCSDSDLSATTALPATTTTTFPFLSDRKNCATLGWTVVGNTCGESDKSFKKGADKCFTWKNHPDAERKCLKLGGRMCSQEDIEAGVGKSTGCGFDSEFLWTSTPCGANSFIQAKGNGDGSTQCRAAKSKGPMRCCSDVSVGGRTQAAALMQAEAGGRTAKQSNAVGFVVGVAVGVLVVAGAVALTHRRTGQGTKPTRVRSTFIAAK